MQLSVKAWPSQSVHCLFAVGVNMYMLMIFMFCFFLGFMAMYWYLLRKIENIARMQSDESAQLRVLMRAMEARLDKMSQMERLNALFQGKLAPDAKLPGEEGAAADESAGHDPLLHLSFEQPASLSEAIDPGLDLNMDPPKPWELASGSQKRPS